MRDGPASQNGGDELMTITHACGHKRRVTLKSVGAARKSAEAFDLSSRNCADCEADERESLCKQRANWSAMADGVWPPYPSEY